MKTAPCFLLVLSSLVMCACGRGRSLHVTTLDHYVMALNDLPAGSIIKASDLGTRTAGSNGFHLFPEHPEYATKTSQVIGHTVVKDIPAGWVIEFSDISQ